MKNHIKRIILSPYNFLKGTGMILWYSLLYFINLIFNMIYLFSYIMIFIMIYIITFTLKGSGYYQKIIYEIRVFKEINYWLLHNILATIPFIYNHDTVTHAGDGGWEIYDEDYQGSLKNYQ